MRVPNDRIVAKVSDVSLNMRVDEWGRVDGYIDFTTSTIRSVDCGANQVDGVERTARYCDTFVLDCNFVSRCDVLPFTVAVVLRQ